MITEAQIYWLIKLDDIRMIFDIMSDIALCLMIFVACGLLVSKIIQYIEDGQVGAKASWVSRRFFIWTIISVGLFVATYTAQRMVPSTKQMAAIVVVPKICNAAAADPALKQIPGQITELASQWLKELRPDNAKEAIEDATKDDVDAIKKKASE